MKAWRSNQDLQDLIRRAEEVRRSGGGHNRKTNHLQEEGGKKGVVIFPVLRISFPRCFSKAEV